MPGTVQKAPLAPSKFYLPRQIFVSLSVTAAAVDAVGITESVGSFAFHGATTVESPATRDVGIVTGASQPLLNRNQPIAAESPPAGDFIKSSDVGGAKFVASISVIGHTGSAGAILHAGGLSRLKLHADVQPSSDLLRSSDVGGAKFIATVSMIGGDSPTVGLLDAWFGTDALKVTEIARRVVILGRTSTDFPSIAEYAHSPKFGSATDSLATSEAAATTFAWHRSTIDHLTILEFAKSPFAKISATDHLIISEIARQPFIRAIGFDELFIQENAHGPQSFSAHDHLSIVDYAKGPFVSLLATDNLLAHIFTVRRLLDASRTTIETLLISEIAQRIRAYYATDSLTISELATFPLGLRGIVDHLTIKERAKSAQLFGNLVALFNAMITTVNQTVLGVSREDHDTSQVINLQQTIADVPTILDLSGNDILNVLFIKNLDNLATVQVDSSSAFDQFPQLIPPGSGIYLSPDIPPPIYAQSSFPSSDVQTIVAGRPNQSMTRFAVEHLLSAEFALAPRTLFVKFDANVHDASDNGDFIHIGDMEGSDFVAVYLSGNQFLFYGGATGTGTSLSDSIGTLDTWFTIEMKIEFPSGLVTPRVNGTEYTAFTGLVLEVTPVGSITDIRFGGMAAILNNHNLDNLTIGTSTWGSSDLFAADFNDFSISPPFDSITGVPDASDGTLFISSAGLDVYAEKFLTYP